MNTTGRKRKKGIRLLIAYLLQISIPLLILIVLVFCYQNLKSIFSDRSGEVTAQQGSIHQTSAPPIPKSLSVITVVIDPGHGGSDSGCIVGDISEKDINLSVSLLLKEKLEEQDIAIIMTRDSDINVGLSERAEITNQAEADCFISIHCNSYEDDITINGLECYYYNSSKGKNLANALTDAASKSDINTRKIKEEDFRVLRETLMPAVLVEIGFLTNPAECSELLSSEYQRKLVAALAEGLLSAI